MAKALLGYMSSDPRTTRLPVERLARENRDLRERVADLEALVTRLSEENDSLLAASPADLLESVEEMQPA